MKLRLGNVIFSLLSIFNSKEMGNQEYKVVVLISSVVVILTTELSGFLIAIDTLASSESRFNVILSLSK
jgi:hypothetical protein